MWLRSMVNVAGPVPKKVTEGKLGTSCRGVSRAASRGPIMDTQATIIRAINPRNPKIRFTIHLLPFDGKGMKESNTTVMRLNPIIRTHWPLHPYSVS
jgi:hypothetical protein